MRTMRRLRRLSTRAGRTGDPLFGMMAVLVAASARPATVFSEPSPSSMITGAFAGPRDTLLFMVTQHPAGDLVDEMNPGTGRTDYGFIAVRMIRRRRIVDVNLNIHAGLRAAKYQIAHFAS